MGFAATLVNQRFRELKSGLE